MTQNTPRTVRERVRIELTSEIKDVARRHLAEHGSSALSLRAVAREMGMVSSAVYRYFPSRDDLLTALIVDAYDAIGEVAEASERTMVVHRAGTVARWQSLASDIRVWAAAHPQEYALIYGSPIPGYKAPPDTVDPAARVSFVMMRIMIDGIVSGEISTDDTTRIPRPVHADFAILRDLALHEVPDAVISRGLLMWTQLFGTISFELFGHLHNVIHDYDAFFELQTRRAGEYLVSG